MFKHYDHFHPTIYKGGNTLLWICGKTFSGGSVVKNPPANAGDTGSVPASGNPLEKEMATHSSRKATVYGVRKGLDTTQGLNNNDRNLLPKNTVRKCHLS